MKTQANIIALASSVLLLGTSAGAFADGRYETSQRGGAQYDYANVISTQPVVRYVTVTTPVRECWEETQYVERRYRRGHGNGGGTLVGAIIGGVIGHQIGSGRGNDAATVAGTLIGAAIGNESSRQHNSHQHNGGRHNGQHTRQVERCETRYREHQEERIDGYRVTYRYNGQKYATQMPYDPGEKIRVRVDVRPAR